MRILASDQVAGWLRNLPPASKHAVRLALRGLKQDRGDIRTLERGFGGISAYRIIFQNQPGGVIHLYYANTRDLVCERFVQLLAAK